MIETRFAALALIVSVGVLLAGDVRGVGPGGPPQPAPPAPAATAAELGNSLEDRAATVDWKEVDRTLGVTGELKKGVYHVTIPRDDLNVNVEGMPVPTEAGLASVFHFWVCPCGKTVMTGEFCLADYETDDVIDALRGATVRVTSVSNLLLGEQPRLIGLRFYAEGDAVGMARALKEALKNVGDARTAKQPLK